MNERSDCRGSKCVTVSSSSITRQAIEHGDRRVPRPVRWRDHDINRVSRLSGDQEAHGVQAQERKTDEVEDGGRATAIEEGISALVFDYAKDHSFLEGVDHVDFGILRVIKQFTRHVEVAERSEFQWQDAILKGFAVWRKFRHYGRGIIIGDLKLRTIKFERLPEKARPQRAVISKSSSSKVRRSTPRRSAS